MQLYKNLRDHKKDIIENLVSYVKTAHVERTVDHYKCTRDLEYIYSAITDDLVNNTNDNIRRISSKFWHKGIRQLRSYHVEFEVYDLLEQHLIKILDLPYHTYLHQLIEKLKQVIEHGPDLFYTEQKIQDRRNVVKFNTDIAVPLELENIIDNCIENTPVQNHTNFRFLKATKNDQEIKDFLVKHFFYNDMFNRHMIAISTAPLVYIPIYAETLTNTSGEPADNDHLQVGIHGGAIMQETLNFGYDFAFIGCGPDNTPIPQEVIETWKSIVYERWNVTVNPCFTNPMLCFCIGKGVFENILDKTEHVFSNGDSVVSQVFNINERKYRPKKLFT